VRHPIAPRPFPRVPLGPFRWQRDNLTQALPRRLITRPNYL